MTRSIALLAGDLMIRSAVDGAAQQAGFHVLSLNAAAPGHLAMVPPDALLILDLSHPDSDRLLNAPAADASMLAAAIAFGPHVHSARLEAARHAGIGTVLSRGAFLSQLPRLLSSAASLPAG